MRSGSCCIKDTGIYKVTKNTFQRFCLIRNTILFTTAFFPQKYREQQDYLLYVPRIYANHRNVQIISSVPLTCCCCFSVVPLKPTAKGAVSPFSCSSSKKYFALFINFIVFRSFIYICLHISGTSFSAFEILCSLQSFLSLNGTYM